MILQEGEYYFRTGGGGAPFIRDPSLVRGIRDGSIPFIFLMWLGGIWLQPLAIRRKKK